MLEIADTIVGSLAEVFHVLEPVKEWKEIAEARVKYGGDKPLLTIIPTVSHRLLEIAH